MYGTNVAVNHRMVRDSLMGGGILDSFATRLREIRKRQGLTQKELAEKAGVSYEVVRSYEQGRRINADWSTLQRIVEVLNTTQEYLRIGGNSDPTDDEPAHRKIVIDTGRQMCPTCRRITLLWDRGAGIYVCLNPDCRDTFTYDKLPC